MAYVVAEPCIKCKYTDCVEVCPVDCFYEGPNFLVIHPDECIDCGACEPACPTKAIFPIFPTAFTVTMPVPETWKLPPGTAFQGEIQIREAAQQR